MQYMVRTKKNAPGGIKLAHIWREAWQDTECRQWSTGGIRVKTGPRYQLRAEIGSAPICQNCLNKREHREKHPSIERRDDNRYRVTPETVQRKRGEK